MEEGNAAVKNEHEDTGTYHLRATKMPGTETIACIPSIVPEDVWGDVYGCARNDTLRLQFLQQRQRKSDTPRMEDDF